MRRGALFVLGVLLISGVLAVSYSQDFDSVSGDYSSAHFVVKTLKYEPFPVNPGEWFDVWVKVENVGEEDASNASFELLGDYPFSSDDGVKSFGLISGTKSAFLERQSGETVSHSNQVLLKFHVFVSEDVRDGDYNLRLQTSSGKSVKNIYDLPISVEGSEVDFDVGLQSSGSVGTSFSLTNVGTEVANSIIVGVVDDEWSLFGDRSYAVGSLNDGETTRFVVEGTSEFADLKLNISYTDVSGVRRVISKSVINSYKGNALAVSQGDPFYEKWLFGLIGVFVGIALMGGARTVHKKKRK